MMALGTFWNFILITLTLIFASACKDFAGRRELSNAISRGSQAFKCRFYQSKILIQLVHKSNKW